MITISVHVRVHVILFKLGKPLALRLLFKVSIPKDGILYSICDTNTLCMIFASFPANLHYKYYMELGCC